MTRILDALRKAGPRPSAPAASPVFEPEIGPAAAAASRAPQARPSQPLMGHALAGMLVPSDDVLQQMSSLRVSLEAALPDRGARVIAFVSSQFGEGTTTVAHQFAASLAGDERQRTVIADGNAHEPSLIHDPESRVVRFEPADGSPAGRDSDVALNLHGWALPADIRDAGMFRPDAARAVLEGLASSYDWVILDLPPALETPDAAALAALADGVVLVVQAGRVKRPVVSRAVDLLRKAGARVIGSVLNRRRLEIPGFIYKRI